MAQQELVQYTVHIAGGSESSQWGAVEEAAKSSWTPLRVKIDSCSIDGEQQKATEEARLNSISMFGSCQNIDYQVVKVRCGGSFSLFLLRNGQVFGIGQISRLSQNSQLFEFQTLRHQNIVDICVGFDFSCFLSGDGRLFCCGPNYNEHDNDTLRSPVDQSMFDGFPVVQVSCGGNFVHVLTSDNKLYACDSRFRDVFSKLDLPLSVDGQKIKKVSCGGYHSVILLENGLLYGLNDQHVQLEETINHFMEIPFPRKVRDVVCGYNYIMCIGEDGRLYGSLYGDDMVSNMIMHGQLGSIDKCPEQAEAHGNVVFTQFEYPILEVVTGCSSTSTFVILSNGDIYVTGCNSSGGLGLGDLENRTIFEKLPRIHPTMAVAAATGAFHSHICYYALQHTNLQNKLWMIMKDHKLIDLDIIVE